MDLNEREWSEENPWKNFASRTKPTKGALIFSAVLYALGCAAIPLSFYNEWFALAALVVLSLGALYLTRREKGGAWLTFALAVLAYVVPSALFENAGWLISVSALVSALCVGVLAGSFLQTCTRLYWLLPVLTAIAVGITFAVSGNWLVAASAVILLPASALLAVATVRASYRSSAICAATLGLLAGVVGLFLLWVWKTQGTVSLDAVRAVLDSWQKTMLDVQIAVREEYLAEMARMIEQNPAWTADQLEYANRMMESVRTLMSDEILINSTAKIFNFIPAALFVACAIPAFLAQKMLRGAYDSNGMRAVVTPESEFFTMSVPAAVIYVIAAFVMLGFSNSLSVLVTVADNLCLMLMPGFLVLAVRNFRARFISARQGRVALILFVAVALCCLSVTAIPLAALYGAYLRLFSAFRHRMTQKMNGGDSER